MPVTAPKNDSIFRLIPCRSTPFIEPEDWGASAVDFLDANNGWAGSWTGALYKTTTGGGYGSCVDVNPDTNYVDMRCYLDRKYSRLHQ